MRIAATDPLCDTVKSLCTMLGGKSLAGPVSIDAIRQQAQVVGLDPDLAEQVVRRLPDRDRRAVINRDALVDDICDALVGVLVDDLDPGLRTLSRNHTWALVRNALRSAGQRWGTALLAIEQTVRTTGMGYAPTLPQLCEEMGQWWPMLQPKILPNQDPGPQLLGLLGGVECTPYLVPLLSVWLRTPAGGRGEPPTVAELVMLLLDDKVVVTLQQEPGQSTSWEILVRQAHSLWENDHLATAVVDWGGMTPR